MTIDELESLFTHTYSGSFSGSDRDKQRARRLAVAAVVRALRDEVVPVAHSYAPTSTMLTQLVRRAFDEILASDGEVKAAACEAVDAKECMTPAPAAAPVCEWKQEHKLPGSGWLDCEGNRHWLKSECPCCNRPIKFKEGSE
jgi:hypothetical protein